MRFKINKFKFVAYLDGDEWVLYEEKIFEISKPTPVFGGD